MSRCAMAILWPSFLMTIVLEGLVFSALDPNEFHVGQLFVEASPQAVYTLSFFVFWLVISTSCAITALLWRETDSTAHRSSRI
jgi:ABC-type polysaccharide transport system permease subunit